MSTVLSTIVNRRSIRRYNDKQVTKEQIEAIIKAATWAPSGNNLQPWRFAVVNENKDLIDKIATHTKFYKWVRTAPCLIGVFLDRDVIDCKIKNAELKHIQSIGSSIQNMLLVAHEQGLGTCWIGEILKNKDIVSELFLVDRKLDLMAVISVGYAEGNNQRSKRREFSDNIVSWQ